MSGTDEQILEEYARKRLNSSPLKTSSKYDHATSKPNTDKEGSYRDKGNGKPTSGTFKRELPGA